MEGCRGGGRRCSKWVLGDVSVGMMKERGCGGMVAGCGKGDGGVGVSG